MAAIPHIAQRCGRGHHLKLVRWAVMPFLIPVGRERQTWGQCVAFVKASYTAQPYEAGALPEGYGSAFYHAK